MRLLTIVRTSLIYLGMVFALSGCATSPDWLSASGPSREQVQEKRDTGRIEGIQLIDVNDALARNLAKSKKLGQFIDVFPSNGSNNYLIGPGDIIEVSVWEAPPAMLFGSVVLDPKAGPTTTRVVTFPEQMVTPDGMITMPFAGRVPVKGNSTQEIEADIVKRLTGKANQPQVLVRVIKNNTSNVTVVGEVNNSTLLPLTPKGERLLDALAAGGGVKQPINRVAVQLSRDNLTATMPLDLVIRDPRQNILLKPGDVVTALFQPQSFSVLGATGKNEEIPFEAQGISLAQALARSGGLNDSRADARGVFVFRFEDAKLVDIKGQVPKSADGTVPVVYQIDLRDPASLFVTQNFPVQNRDVIYVANSPEAEFNKFLRLVVSVAMPSVTINRALSN
ncbi:polysaccharide biosynthesis/export family protein [Laribacter hongkongensis]|uniref:Polysaccharide export protein n=1 Tax=Laribacter hongkongensis TaxID=168471 RepID=A0ABD4SU11_9NEIS|nr:polysaccharide biosynthesis/export family protein [Laribacter hongkongensis]MCG9026697.1 polysaccharide export protein [Laribacter hongkongensis]MCG9116353.1 polysaccharide export protein [Laribacter hongkongensis]